MAAKLQLFFHATVGSDVCARGEHWRCRSPHITWEHFVYVCWCRCHRHNPLFACVVYV